MPFLRAGNANFDSSTSSTTKEMPPQMSSLVAGRMGDGASWQSSTFLPSSSSLAHSSVALSAYFPSAAPAAGTIPNRTKPTSAKPARIPRFRFRIVLSPRR
jgi:hypothetical protein